MLLKFKNKNNKQLEEVKQLIKDYNWHLYNYQNVLKEKYSSDEDLCHILFNEIEYLKKGFEIHFKDFL